MLWGISEMVSARAFKALPLCSAPLKNYCRDFWSSQLKRKPLSQQKCVLRKCCMVSQKWYMLELSNLYHCVQMLWGISEIVLRKCWISEMFDHFAILLSILVLRKCCRESRKWWVLELSNLCHCVQHPWKITGRDFWSSQLKRKPLSQQKCVLRKCCMISQKWYMLELSNLCHCVQML